MERLRTALQDVLIEWFPVVEASPLVNWTIGDLAIRKTSGVSVVALVRPEQNILNPGPDHVVLAGDTIVVLGRKASVDAFRERYRPQG